MSGACPETLNPASLLFSPQSQATAAHWSVTRCRRWRPSCAGAASAGGHSSRASRWPRSSCASLAPHAGPRDGRRVTRGDSAPGRRVLRRSLLMAREGGGCHGPTCSCAGAEPRGWAHPHAPPCDARAEAPLATSQCAVAVLLMTGVQEYHVQRLMPHTVSNR